MNVIACNNYCKLQNNRIKSDQNYAKILSNWIEIKYELGLNVFFSFFLKFDRIFK